MHIELLVEEPSAETALRVLVPKIIGSGVSFQIHAFQGKPDLLSKLPSRLRAYRTWLPDDTSIVVLVDNDDNDCIKLKAALESVTAASGLSTPSTRAGRTRIEVVNRIATEELEAWFFGDVAAVRAAYPGVPASLEKRARYRTPDAIKGGTWEALERVLQQHGYFKGGLAKIEVARAIAPFMEPARNRSKSFQVFCAALRQLAH